MAEQREATIELPSDANAPSLARRFVDQHSEDLPPELVGDAELLVTELVTNAVRHGRPRISLRVRVQPAMLGVLVDDEGSALPDEHVSSPGLSAESGRGLLIVDRMSTDWGVVPHGGAEAGKTVWFELSTDGYGADPA